MSRIIYNEGRMRELCRERGLLHPLGARAQETNEALLAALEAAEGIELRSLVERYSLLAASRINQRAVAQAIGIHEAMVSRVMIGQQAVSATFIAATLSYFKVPFEDLFEIISDETPIEAPVGAEVLAS